MAPTQRPIASDLTGLLLAAVTMFLLVSLGSYHPADALGDTVWPLNQLLPKDQLVYPESIEIQNACGWIGAAVASVLFSGLGLSAFLVAVTPAIAAFRLFRDGDIPSPGLRSCGWTLTLVACSTLASHFSLRFQSIPMVGSGGFIGAMTNTWLHDHFAAAGAYILTITVLLFGLLLWTDYFLLAATLWMTRATAKGSNKTWQLARQQVARRRNAALRAPVLLQPQPALPSNLTSKVTDLPDKIASEQAKPGDVAVRIRGRSIEPITPEKLPVEMPLAAAAKLADDSELLETDVDEEAEESEMQEMVDEDGEVAQVLNDVPHPSAPPVRTKKNRKEERLSIEHEINEAAPPGSDEYVLPPVDLLTEAEDICYEEQLKEVQRKAKILEKTFQDFGFNVRVVEIETGPVIAQYEVELEAGLRLSKITGLSDDLAIALRVPSVRIVAPIPGKNTVGIEVPNELRQVVRIREVIEESISGTRKLKIPIFLGKDVSGGPMVVDLASMPHLLIAGRTGTGKSVCLNAIISSILMTRRPDEVRMLMIDPKMVELSGYGRLPHLMHPVVTDMRKAEAILAWAVEKMEERYALLARAGVRHISGYNELGRDELIRRLDPQDIAEQDQIPDQLPYIVIVADEIADLMMTAGKEVEQHIIRLAQKSRAVGIHLILATQKPTVDVITGLIKSNLPARLCFQVASQTDSRVVLDENGANKLLGNGDMLFLWPGTSTLIRGQGTYLSDAEIEAVVAHCSTGEQNFVGELMNLQLKDPNAEEATAQPAGLRKRDEVYESAVDVVVREGRGSVSLLQRTLGIGYGRAARLIDYMAEDGIVGEYNGSQAREVVISLAQWEAMRNGETLETEPSGTTLQAHSAEAPPRPKGASQPANALPARQKAAVVHEESWEDASQEEDESGDWQDDE